MKTKLRSIITITHEYEADSKNYGNVEFVEDMIDSDKKNFNEDPWSFIDSVVEGNHKLSIDIKEIR